MHAHRRLSRLLALAVATAALLVALPSASAAPLNLKVGAALSLTGDAAAYGISSRRGIDLAVREINAGAIPGIRMSVRTIDDESTVPGAATAYGVFFHDISRALNGRTGQWGTRGWLDEARAAAYAERRGDQADRPGDAVGRELVADDPEAQGKQRAAGALHDAAGDEQRDRGDQEPADAARRERRLRRPAPWGPDPLLKPRRSPSGISGFRVSE
mgnify:CR=1 FL=1